MGNGLLYQVPRFQRDYSWSEDEWEDLWQDIQTILSEGEGSAHYMGYLVLQTQDNRKFDIIDGQQRLTTLSILILAVLLQIQQLIDIGVDIDNNRRRLEQLRNSYIGYLNPVTLISTSKLTLNRHNDYIYQNYLVLLQLPAARGLKASERLMSKALKWFQDKLTKDIGRTSGGDVFAGFIDKIVDRLFFTVITVNDELNAFTVFETLNARGVRLSATDLLKNYLFSVLHREGGDDRELDLLEDKWEKMSDKLGAEDLPDFLRTYWNSKYKLVRHNELFKSLRARIRSKQEVFELLRNLEMEADVYAALSMPEDSLWEHGQRKHIALLKLFGVRQLFPLLLSGYRKFQSQATKDFTLLLKTCTILVFRNNVIANLGTAEQERIYNSIARSIWESEPTTIQDIIHALQPIYLSDQEFEALFGEKQLRTSSRNVKIVKYILFELEKADSGSDYDWESDKYSLEHVLPQNPEEGWENFSDAEVEQFVYRLGNLALLEKKDNRELGNAGFAAKSTLYQKSEFESTRKIAQDNGEWSPERIANRQRAMAKKAKSIWKISQLS